MTEKITCSKFLRMFLKEFPDDGKERCFKYFGLVMWTDMEPTAALKLCRHEDWKLLGLTVKATAGNEKK